MLLEKYVITPTPHVVELDEHPLGSHIQDVLEDRTGRRTVPNIMISGVSIGGADDIVDLEHANTLMARITELGKQGVTIASREAL